MLGLLLVLGAGLEVSGPVGCVDANAVGAAVDAVGGIDIAEAVAIRVTPTDDGYALVVDIALADAAPLHREVALRPRECADVADLVALLVKNQRRARTEAPAARSPRPREAPRAMDPRTRPADYARQRAAVGWGLCEGPTTCGGLRMGVSAGVSLPTGNRLALDAGWDIDERWTGIAAAEAFVTRGGLAAGVAWRTRVDVLEMSARGLLGAGGGIGDYGAGYYVSPTVAVRARVGYVFAELGTFWPLPMDRQPGAYLVVGMAPVGP